MTDILIRECTSADIEKVMELDRDWAAEDSTYGYVAESAEGFADRLGTYFLVTEVQDSIVGFAYGSVRVSEGMAVLPAGQTYFEVDAIYVTTEYRNSGIGGMLLNGLLEAARHNGIERSLIYSATKDLDRILRFYRRHGFKELVCTDVPLECNLLFLEKLLRLLTKTSTATGTKTDVCLHSKPTIQGHVHP